MSKVINCTIKSNRRSAFTIVELIVVITVIGILAGLTVLGFGAWRHSVASTQVKSDLASAAASMEATKNFSAGYPTSFPSSLTGTNGTTSWTASDGSTVNLTSSTTTTFCLDGTISSDSAVIYYIDSTTIRQGAQTGNCAGRTGVSAPTAPTGLAVTSSVGTTVNLSWSVSANTTTYTAQCASDSGFVIGTQQTSTVMITGSTVTASITGLTPSTSFYCRVNAANATGTSAWSTAVNTTTTNSYGSLAVGTSIEGYWTTAPQGFILEDGSAVSRTTYSDLFAIIGTTYGAGDGSTTFNLPDSRGQTVVNQLTTDTNFATIGQKTGTKTVTLALSQIPLHTHTQLVGTVDDKNFTGYQIAGQYPPADGPGLYNSGVTTGATGGGGAHNNIQPSIVKTFAIKYAPIDPVAATLPAGTSIHGYWSSLPTGYLAEDGSAVSRTTYLVLFAAIGTTYGTGDGSTTFNLPDSRARATVNLSSTDTEFNSMGKKYGEENHQLTISELPSHSHPIAIGQVDDKNWTGYTTGANQYPPGDAAGSYDTGDQTGNTGSGGTSTFSDIQPSITELAAIKYTAATGTGNPVAVGTSLSGYWSVAPSGYLYEDGSAVSRTTYSALFGIIGTTYGTGDGSTTFNLPDSRGRVSVNLSPSDVEFNTMGEKYGEKAHTLTVAEIPSHTHTLSLGTVDDQNFTGYTGPGQYAPADGPGAYYTGITTGSTGGGQAFNLIQPSIVKLVVIKY